MTAETVREMIEEESSRLLREGEWGSAEQVAAAADILRSASLSDRLPGFFTPYAFVRYLTDAQVRSSGAVSEDDLRMSEKIDGHVSCWHLEERS